MAPIVVLAAGHGIKRVDTMSTGNTIKTAFQGR